MRKTDGSQEKVLIGKVGSPVGIKGEFRVTLYAQDSGNLKEGKVLLLERVEKTMSAAVKSVRYQKDRPVIRLEGVEDRNAAEDIRGMEISIRACDLEELPEGEHYVRDLIGCRVVDIARSAAGEGGAEIGVLADVIQNTAQSILDVETPEGRRVLIPAVDAFLRNIDEEAGIIEVELIPGFLD
ncbi:MAG: 16S rRNA processing protein RimM [Clostridiales bacterium]|nr:16S rRNA processing protein RimM [Clostridiales bacterium]